jgi:hypothetical protein
MAQADRLTHLVDKNTYWIQVAIGATVPKPPIRSMSRVQAQQWISAQCPEHQSRYSIQLSVLAH